jgi:hypothetical protein
MATLQTDGLTSVTATSTKNNSGTLLANTNDTKLFNTLDTTTDKVGAFGSTVIDGTDTNKIDNSKEIPFNNESILAKKLNLDLANEPGLTRSIHKLEVLRTRLATTAIRNNKFDIYTGKFDAGYPLVIVDSLNSDTAANPTRDNPGLLNYHSSGPGIISDSYEKKTG